MQFHTIPVALRWCRCWSIRRNRIGRRDPELIDRVDSELLLRTISYRHAHMHGQRRAIPAAASVT